MLRLFKFSLLICTVWLTACTSHPVMNVFDRPVPDRLDGKPQTMESVAKGIIAGCMDKGWTCKKVAPGKIDASLALRKHRATTEINFDTNRYSIVYKDSYLLDYNARRNTIHRNYNNWINNLDHAIAKNLAI
ncbi:hypothetical protein [uncultured Microbulbifer sp.]|uniref:hypothetical protein n=1 Tax=uncultured Microbulbifer sp. TaxID=348147 RepID=UPI0025F5A3AA|nr:hypothetical protein [uncultured Microbulbifer sp.]